MEEGHTSYAADLLVYAQGAVWCSKYRAVQIEPVRAMVVDPDLESCRVDPAISLAILVVPLPVSANGCLCVSPFRALHLAVALLLVRCS